ncbi:MAG: MarR family winged helix-turn-helix transcriptional regulator [Marmoricola sp.]
MDTTLTDLGGQLVVLSARLIREVRRANAEHPTHLRVLSMLDEYGPSTVSALAQADGCTQPSMTALVNALVERAWVTREPHPADARSSLITTTAEGRAALQRFREHNAQVLAERIARSGRSADDVATAVAVLTDLLRPG